MSRILHCVSVCLVGVFVAGPVLAAFEVRLTLPGGGAAAGFTVSVVGQPVTALTDGEGRLSLDPSPTLPFVLVATSPSGETSAPFEIADPAVGEVVLPDDGDFKVLQAQILGGFAGNPAFGEVKLEEQGRVRHHQVFIVEGGFGELAGAHLNRQIAKFSSPRYNSTIMDTTARLPAPEAARPN